ncbi:MAG: hypothetical protein NXI24_24295 [bacterium]|nr:hypothetical protein [bacterium]
MIAPSTAQALPDTPNLQQLWKSRPSQHEGFARNYYTETVQGDQLEVDFNYGRRMTRISLRVAAENGREYVALFKSGTILQEREVAGKRSVDLTSRLGPLANYFQFLPDETALQSIGGNYGLPTQPVLPAMRGSGRQSDVLPINSRFSVRGWIREYFRRKREASLELEEQPWYIRAFQRAPAELTDIGLGLILYYAYLQNALNLTELAGYLGALGLFSGAMDWVWRQRDPFLPKVAGLLTASAFAVYLQLQYRMWGIFL